MMGSHRPIAAVDHHDRSGDVGREIGGEEDRGADDVFRGAGASQRGVIHEGLHQLRIGGARVGVQAALR